MLIVDHCTISWNVAYVSPIPRIKCRGRSGAVAAAATAPLHRMKIVPFYRLTRGNPISKPYESSGKINKDLLKTALVDSRMRSCCLRESSLHLRIILIIIRSRPRGPWARAASEENRQTYRWRFSKPSLQHQQQKEEQLQQRELGFWRAFPGNR